MASRYGELEQTSGCLPSRNIDSLFKYLSNHLKAPLSILIIGETGSGKSTLVNNLIGEDVAKVGKTIESETSDITLHKGRVRGVDVRIFDTPGLWNSRNEKQDSRTLKKLKSHFESSQFSLVIFCFPIYATRMSQYKIDIFRDYHEIGIPWHRTFIALTFADITPTTLPGKDTADAYEIKLVYWWERITTTLTALDIISEEVAEKLNERVFPTTYEHSTKLPNGQEWYTPMWISILEHILQYITTYSTTTENYIDNLLSHLKAPLSILIIGETGSGKSTLVNNLIGDVAKIGKTAQSETKTIKVYKHRIKGVDVIVSDTAGLRDSRGTKQDSKVLKALKSKFKAEQYSLVIFCFKMTETRMSQDKINIFKEYHKIGIPWDRTFIALTFADIGHRTICDSGISEEAAHQEKLEMWQKEIVTALQGIDGRIDEAIKERIFPTTSKHSLRLPNNEDWLAPMWVKILETANKETVTLCLQLRCNDILPPSYARQQQTQSSVNPDIDSTSPPNRPRIDLTGLRERYVAVLQTTYSTFVDEHPWEAIKLLLKKHEED